MYSLFLLPVLVRPIIGRHPDHYPSVVAIRIQPAIVKRHVVSIAALLLSIPVVGLGGTTGSLEGVVTDSETDQPLVGANILLLSTRQGASTDTTGFLQDPQHQGRVLRSSDIDDRLQNDDVSDVVILPDRRSKLNVSMKESPIELEAMEVISESPLIQTEITGTSYEIDAEVLINRPIDSFSEVVALQPGTTVEGNIRGGKVREALYLIDGLPVQDVIRGGLGTELPKSAILQMSVKTGGFDAEYGNALSGVINVITRTGGDDREFSLRAAKDNLFGGTEVSKRHELELMASGPRWERRRTFLLFSHQCRAYGHPLVAGHATLLRLPDPQGAEWSWQGGLRDVAN